MKLQKLWEESENKWSGSFISFKDKRKLVKLTFQERAHRSSYFLLTGTLSVLCRLEPDLCKLYFPGGPCWPGFCLCCAMGGPGTRLGGGRKGEAWTHACLRSDFFLGLCLLLAALSLPQPSVAPDGSSSVESLTSELPHLPLSTSRPSKPFEHIPPIKSYLFKCLIFIEVIYLFIDIYWSLVFLTEYCLLQIENPKRPITM